MKKSTLIIIISAAVLAVIAAVAAVVTVYVRRPGVPDNIPDEFKSVEAVGEVPERFRRVVTENLFFNAYSNEYGIVTVRDKADGQTVSLCDKYGEKKIEFFAPDHDYRLVTYAAATEDGGLIYVDGFVMMIIDRFDGEEGASLDDEMFCRVVKLDKNGGVQWSVRLEKQEAYEMISAFQRGDSYFFVWRPTVDFESGEYDPDNRTSVSVTEINKNGELLRNEVFFSADFLYPDTLKVKKNETVLYCSISADGEHNKLKYVYFNDRLEVIKSENVKMNDKSNPRGYTSWGWLQRGSWYLGYLNGDNFYDTDFFIKNFNDGYVTSVIEYENGFLVISEHATEKTVSDEQFADGITYLSPKMDRHNLKTETVYGFYNKNGRLIWRASVDSTENGYENRLHDYIQNWYY